MPFVDSLARIKESTYAVLNQTVVTSKRGAITVYVSGKAAFSALGAGFDMKPINASWIAVFSGSVIVPNDFPSDKSIESNTVTHDASLTGW
jgi:hypothetical protein